jgi:uncharacterized protein YecE (DUF72 family)
MWAKKGATTGERFDYLYSEPELGQWLPAIERLGGTRELHLLMNNCVQDKAVVNARQLALMVGGTLWVKTVGASGLVLSSPPP